MKRVIVADFLSFDPIGICIHWFQPPESSPATSSSPRNHTSSQPRHRWLCNCRMPSYIPMADPYFCACTQVQPPQAVSLYSTGLMPVNDLHCHSHTQRETMQPQETHKHPGPHSAHGPRSGSDFYHCSVPLCSPAASPSSCVDAHPLFNPHH